MNALALAFHPTSDVDWLFKVSPLVEKSDGGGGVRIVRKELRGFPTCQRTCTDAARLYRVFGIWHVPWQTFVAAETAFLARWFALPAWRRRSLVHRFGFYALELHPDTWLESLARRDDAVFLAALLADPRFQEKTHNTSTAATALPLVLLRFAAVQCLETFARRRGFVDGQWAFHLRPYLIPAGMEIMYQQQPIDDARLPEMLQLLQRHQCDEHDLQMFARTIARTLVCENRHASLQFLVQQQQQQQLLVPDVRLCALAAEEGHLECLRVLLPLSSSGGCQSSAERTIDPADPGLVFAAARAGRLDVIKYLHLEHGCRWNAETCAAAAFSGRLACLEYLHQNGCAWDEWTCARAAQVDCLACLQYAHQNGCPLESEMVCCLAVERDSVECLQYAHQNGCPLTADICRRAAGVNAILCLQYARGHNCPWDREDCLERAASRDMRRWILKLSKIEKKKKKKNETPKTKTEFFRRALL